MAPRHWLRLLVERGPTSRRHEITELLTYMKSKLKMRESWRVSRGDLTRTDFGFACV